MKATGLAIGTLVPVALTSLAIFLADKYPARAAVALGVGVVYALVAIVWELQGISDALKRKGD